jgi:hypothetical protein
LTQTRRLLPKYGPMKYPTLWKLTLTTLSLLATFALTAHAGRSFLSPAKYQPGFRADKASALARILSPLATYQIDDGTAEDAVGFGNGIQNLEAVWFNQFDVIPGQTSISTVSVAWGTPFFPDPAMDGTPITIGIWSDPNGDGNPSDAVLLGQVSGTIQNSGTDTFVDYTLRPEEFFQGIDENSTLHRQSWVAAMSDGSAVDFENPGNNDVVGLIDDFGIPGNWLIRANAGGGGGEITLTAKLRRQTGKVLVALEWTGTDDTGTMNILRDGVVIHTAEDDGRAQDHLGDAGRQSHTYQVCEPDTGNCSNVLTVRIP